MYCFYLFSAGGPFHYEGFGFGSFMFGNIAAQIMGYYLIAFLLIPLGLGHLRLRRWARTAGLALLYAWLVVGAPLSLVFLLVLFASKELSPLVSWTAVLVMVLSYPLVPLLLIRFYQSQGVKATFESRSAGAKWLEERPIPVVALGFLLGLYAIVMHVPIFFRGIFPFFGRFLVDMEGIMALDLSILCLACLAWGVFRQKTWAWWGSLLFVGLLTCSSILTLVSTSYAQLLALLRFPPTELEFLDGVPLQGWHLAAFVGLPLLLTVGATLISKRHFDQEGPSLI
jgi:hypothetical protein